MAAVVQARTLGDFPGFLDIETALLANPDTQVLDKRLLKFIAKIFQRTCFHSGELCLRLQIALIKVDLKLGSSYSQNDKVFSDLIWVLGNTFSIRA